MENSIWNIVIFAISVILFGTTIYLLGLKPWQSTKKKSQPSKEERDQERLYTEHILFILWLKNQHDGVYTFPDINIGKEDNPYYINNIRYNLEERTLASCHVLASIASDDKLVLVSNNGESNAAPVFKTQELKKLINGITDGKPSHH